MIYDLNKIYKNRIAKNIVLESIATLYNYNSKTDKIPYDNKIYFNFVSDKMSKHGDSPRLKVNVQKFGKVKSNFVTINIERNATTREDLKIIDADNIWWKINKKDRDCILDLILRKIRYIVNILDDLSNGKAIDIKKIEKELQDAIYRMKNNISEQEHVKPENVE